MTEETPKEERSVKIGILDGGNQSRSLGLRRREVGQDVFFGSRTPGKGMSVAESSPGNGRDNSSAIAAFSASDVDVAAY